MEKIYNLLVHQVCDCEEIRLDVIPYLDYNEAKKAFDDIVREENEYALKHNWVLDDKNNDTYFCAYDDGRFTENNTLIELTEHSFNV